MADSTLITKVIDFLQGDIPAVHRPYASLAGQLGCSEADILEVIHIIKAQGIMRRFGAILRHQQAGFVNNAMVAWQVPVGSEDESGVLMASYPQVSHCYWRKVPEDFPYQLFTMIHARNEEELQQVLNAIAAAIEIIDFEVLRSIREFKKVSMRYQLEDWLLPSSKEEV